MFKFYSSSQILAITRDLPLKSCIKIRSCQSIWVHLGRGGRGGGGCCLRQHTKVAVRPHMVLDTKRQPSPESNLKCLFVRTLSLTVGRFIVDPTQLFMNNPNWIIKCTNISLCPWSFNHSDFCLVDFLLFDTNLCFKS